MRAFIFHLIIKLNGLLSLSGSHKLAHFLANIFWRFSAKQRHITLTNIGLCYPNKSLDEQRQLAKDSLIETLKAVCELGVVWRRYPNQFPELIKAVKDQQILDDALAQGRGVLLAAPHFGNWEVLNLWLSRYDDFAFLYKPPSDKKIEELLLTYRGQGGAKQITADAKGVRTMLKHLSHKGIMAILPDQQPKSGQGVYADFMGQSAYTMTLLSKIAHKTDAPVVLAVAERQADGFIIHFKKADEGIYGDMQQSVMALNQDIAKLVSLNPAQYQWTYKRFSIQKNGTNPYLQTK
ncbi:lysophospholipid acyltransferase family protein [Marinicella gelatinilytica]|uniref:lysophospholipid acyltransferase family protein n=1 Tax=Marinicella gelatinilytica TaxID=2996017 RepID=UPI002260A189|nr:lysophospholipid acyltransferase family protein [Marinicella gelatinilytica]MCX7544129.1 lysophospholipid acyltransferase family protein [Marinicella gelatinilytica]